MDDLNRYRNLLEFVKYRGLLQKSPVLSDDAFRKQMQSHEYVRVDCVCKKEQRAVLVYLFTRNARYMKHSGPLKQLLSKISDPSDVILIGARVGSSYIRDAIQQFSLCKTYTYLHQHFSTIIPRVKICGVHTIVPADQLEVILADIHCVREQLPRIMVHDPQCIWLGAKPGDVVKVVTDSSLTLQSMKYLLVISASYIEEVDDSDSDEDEEVEEAEADAVDA
jgi:DNA-directed RNA polymerase subunit H (RpoH/RPB5)